MQTSSEIEDELDRRGFTVLRGVLDDSEVESLRRFLTSALSEQHRKPTKSIGIQTTSSQCDAIWPDFYQCNPDWFDVFCNPRIIAALRQLLGDPFVLTRDSIVHWGYFPDWHTDTTTSEVDGKLAHRIPGWRMLTVGIYLQSGAALTVVSGSHQSPDPFVGFRRSRRTGGSPIEDLPWPPSAWVDIPIDAGDAVIFDMRLIHRASRTTTRTTAGRPCQKIAIFSRVGRNIPRHLTAYSEFGFNGAGTSDRNLSLLREQAARWGFLVG